MIVYCGSQICLSGLILNSGSVDWSQVSHRGFTDGTFRYEGAFESRCAPSEKRGALQRRRGGRPPHLVRGRGSITRSEDKHPMGMCDHAEGHFRSSALWAVLATNPQFTQERPMRPRRRRAPKLWGAGSTFLLLDLGLQARHFETQPPETRGGLFVICFWGGIDLLRFLEVLTGDPV